MSKTRLDAMHEVYGYATGLCKDCCNYRSGRYHDRILRKCEAYGMTHSEASDWKGSGIACGLYNVPFEETGKRPLIQWRPGRYGKKEAGPVEGQVGMEL